MRPITSVEPNILGLLAPEAAVDIFRRLLWAEADRAGIGPALVSVPGAINVADGGVDAEIAEIPDSVPGGLLFPGLTRYQIKTGAFSAGNNSEMKELFLKKNGKELKDRVRACFEKGGTFVVVLFGSDTPDRADDELNIACQTFLGQFAPAFKDRHIRVLRQNQIAGFLDRHVPLALRAQLQAFPNLRTHDEWGGEIESLGALKAGPPQDTFIKQVRTELRQPTATHLCVWGEPGIGKTRLLYEATGVDDLSPAIAYFRSPHALEQSGVVDELVRNPSKSAIVVVDDCTSRDRESIWRQLKALGRRARLVTVQHEPSDSSGTTIVLPTPQLADEQISQIIQQHGIPKDAADRFAPYCGGSPRVANVVGWNLQNNPEDLTRPLETTNVWDRFVEGADPPSSDLVAQRKLVISYLALFKRFGYGQPYEQEAKAIAKLIEQADPAVTWPRFQEIVRSLHQRRILQGETTLYITPRLLHIKLWCDWWDRYGQFLKVDELLAEVPDSLHGWFYEMFSYAHGSEAATKTVRLILSIHGSFFKGGLLKTELGANFFLNLTEANTEAALEFLEATIGKESREELQGFSIGRQRVVWSLEKIAVERAFFPSAARLLLRLAETENNPSISNNATGTFAALFSLGPGKTAPTQAPPAERMPVLTAALYSESKEARMVALRACDEALNSQTFSRMAGAERRGLKDLQLWSPKTYDEWHEAYRQVWEMLRRRVPTLPPEEQSKAAHVLLQHSFSLVQVEPLEGMVTATVSELAGLPSISRKELLETVLDVLERQDNLPETVKRRWREIEEIIVGGHDFQARLKRRVALPHWRLAPESGLSTEPWRALAEEAVRNPQQLLSQLAWLTTGEAESAASFGYELGRMNQEFAFQRPIIEAIAQAGASGNPGILGGYLRAMHEADPKRWLSAIENLSQRQETKRLFPGVVMQSGLDDDAAAILARLVRDKDMPAHYLQGFVFGREIRNLSVHAFQSWIELLLHENQQAVIVALQLLHYYCLDEQAHSLPSSLVEAVLLHEALFEQEGNETRGSNRDYDWSQVAQKYIEGHADRKLVVAKRMLEGMGKDGVVLPRFGHSYSHQLLSKIAKELPHEVWGIAAPLLGPPLDSRAYSIKDWLRGGQLAFGGGGKEVESVLSSIPLQELWTWVEQDVERRAWYLASFVPKDLVGDPSIPSVAREMLIRYGDRDDVQRNLIANYSTEGWMGPESEHHRLKKEELERLLETEQEPRVREWLNRYIGYLRRSVEQARMVEERENL